MSGGAGPGRAGGGDPDGAAPLPSGVSDLPGAAQSDPPGSTGAPRPAVAGTPARPSAPGGSDRAGGHDGPAHPDAALLDRVALGALTRIDAMRPSFRLPDDVATDANPNTTLKPLGELAELADVVRTAHPLPAARALAGELFAFAWKETRGGELFAELVRGEPQATYPVELYGVFARAGLRNPAVEELLAATTGLRLWQVAREDHTRTLNVLNAERRIGLPPHADFAEVLAMTGLGRRPEPWALDRRTAYGLTHDVFHVTDWGRVPGLMPEPLAGYLRLWLPAWTASWLEERQWDLAGELLAVAACVPQAPYDPAAWREFAAAQRRDGAVPEVGDGPPEGAPPQEQFIGCYHSTLVAAFAATLARAAAGSGGAPGTAPSTPEATPAPAPPSAAVAEHTPAPAESEVLP
ncbi:hypothetical protein SAMN05216223_110164 [Actinacidiphila yanglinensis]|uniref:DUF6895 domain-containing protein n=1 Tax=Actinacidiphila yanglinensis TaxID=310779 RepID=A0A1H6CW45_9ACTN|nr:hypothetical protein [Actinacidiphila yanglinensis]SEG77037.1 hypothetical protein SAMN05216223_110164 [Actinacidiphila yanglinensis]